MKLIEYPDMELLARRLAGTLAGELTAALEHRERVLFVVPGGTTPGPVFDTLCESGLDWSRVDVLLSDERWLPEDHPRSNTRLVRARLLRGRAAKARLLPLHTRAESPEEALAELEAKIAPALPIDVCLLGMGEDMHVASLFPGADNLRAALDAGAPILMAMRAAGMPEPRVSLSARVLAGARALDLVITGAPKRAALERARALAPFEAPVAAVLDAATVHWAP